MGSTGGGVWKSEDYGITWKNISDGFFKTGTVGAISVSERQGFILKIRDLARGCCEAYIKSHKDKNFV